MSWDKTIKSIKCPCGKGTIEQEVRDDDWNRTEYGAPYICCDECKKKYKVVMSTYGNPIKGYWNVYRLVPFDFTYSVDFVRKYDENKKYDYAKSDFAKYLICSFSKKMLLEAINEIGSKTSVASLIGIASRIGKECRKYQNSCKITDLKVYVNKAVEEYDNFDGNFEQLCEQEQENIKIKEIRNKELEKVAIVLDL